MLLVNVTSTPAPPGPHVLRLPQLRIVVRRMGNAHLHVHVRVERGQRVHRRVQVEKSLRRVATTSTVCESLVNRSAVSVIVDDPVVSSNPCT